MVDKVIQTGESFNFSATGALPVADCGDIIGILCSTSSAGTLTLVDGKGRTLCNLMPMTAGQFYPLPARYISGLTATVGGTLNATICVA